MVSAAGGGLAVAGAAEPPFRRGERREWPVGTPAAYTGYRLTLTARRASRAVRVAEVRLRGADLDTAASPPLVEYRRGLDLESGVHTTRFGATGRRVTREAFASRAADLIVLHYEADSAGALDCEHGPREDGVMYARTAARHRPVRVRVDGREVQVRPESGRG